MSDHHDAEFVKAALSMALLHVNAVKRPGKALEALIELEKLSNGRIPRDWTRQQAWTDIVWAQASLGNKDYGTAVSKAKGALLVCQDIHSVGNYCHYSTSSSTTPGHTIWKRA